MLERGRGEEEGGAVLCTGIPGMMAKLMTLILSSVSGSIITYIDLKISSGRKEPNSEK